MLFRKQLSSLKTGFGQVAKNDCLRESKQGWNFDTITFVNLPMVFIVKAIGMDSLSSGKWGCKRQPTKVVPRMFKHFVLFKDGRLFLLPSFINFKELIVCQNKQMILHNGIYKQSNKLN
ncbi:MAG TPA: hypothetical protein DIW21_01600 [Enterococcus sp.]|nr:hypothetical protein [Enterococcus sp.]